MKLEFDNPNQIISHMILENMEVVNAIIDTEQFKNKEGVTITVFANGVEIPAIIIENTMHQIMKRYEAHVREKYDAPNIDRMVYDKAQQLLTESANTVIDQIDNLRFKLENITDMIKPYWEK